MLSKHILPKSKAHPKQARTERSEILSLSNSLISHITEPSHFLCTLDSPLSTCPLHWLIQDWSWVMWSTKRLIFLLVVNKTMQDESAFSSTAILFPLFLKMHHYTDALLPNTDCSTYLCSYKWDVRLEGFRGDWPELKQLLYRQGSYRLLCVTN